MLNLALLTVALTTFFTACRGQVPGFGPACVICSDTIFMDTGYSSLFNITENRQCEAGHGPNVESFRCNPGSLCSTVNGTETRFFPGYGDIRVRVVIRSCDNAEVLGVTGGDCLPADIHDDVLEEYNVWTGTTHVEFVGTICYCSGDNCNNQAVPEFTRPFRPHTPPPDAMGLQCRVCSHLSFHDDLLNDPTLDNPDCEDGSLTSSNVHYITCFEGSVCMSFRGQITYLSDGFELVADVFERKCHIPGEPIVADTGCLDESEVTEGFADYYSFVDDALFEGGACYCNSDICTCDPTTCSDATLTCADGNFCTGENEQCADGLIGPRCECVEGYEKDARMMCQLISRSCITCTSYHFVSQFTSRTDLEDLSCEMGTSQFVDFCPDDSVCATVVGTEVRDVDGVANVTIRVVKRGCESSLLFDRASATRPCLADPLSGAVLDTEIPSSRRVSFTGEACYCTGDNCNRGLEDIDRVMKPDHPNPDSPGLQCVSCKSHMEVGAKTEEGDAERREACLEGDLTHPDVFYDTCPRDFVCLKVQGEFTYLKDAESTSTYLVERRCFPKNYTTGEPEGCLVMDKIRQNLEMDYYSYYFYFDDIEVDAPACYCSTDVCDCDLDGCPVGSCDSTDDICSGDNEKCVDTVMGPECLCNDGYERNTRRQCQLIEKCSTKTCSMPHSECKELRAGATCVCKKNYILDAREKKCISILNNNGNTDGITGDNSALGLSGNRMMLLATLITATLLTRGIVP